MVGSGFALFHHPILTHTHLSASQSVSHSEPVRVSLVRGPTHRGRGTNHQNVLFFLLFNINYNVHA